MANRIPENRARNHYAAFSRTAAYAERSSDYQNAAYLWSKAANYSRSVITRFWAERRSEFCHNAAERGWGQPDESAAI
ncbi:ANR family transcriptional regulator [Xenorhabdus cabanillasii]|uniref:ANR family transcriptional regulator n=1 Tax=Xenorhabdus cabanillasii JM26 TaxID=1427517 RepID=W1IMS9_9GAMM|nr:ANR family transcriptional regulator [Xenorhabdus cabanillasii]PHM78420.1 hypothetical protein Xcab_01036 [Xenorhabdus cabanillasii JM26]CDL79754.1 Predicted protein [Xenorhabdus cabanillasii JM26]